MNWFEGLFFFVITSGLTAILKLHFSISFSGAKHKKTFYAIFLVFTYSIELAGQWLQAYWVATLLNMLFLVSLSYFLLKVSLPNALLTSIIAECVMSIAFEIAKAIAGILYPLLLPIDWNYGAFISIGSVVVSLLLAYVGYTMILKKSHFDRSAMKQYFAIFLLPILFVLLACGYISNTFYGSEIVMDSSGVVQPGVNHWFVLFVQVLAGLLLFGTLHACQKLSEGFAAQTRLALLEQEVSTQRGYLQEALSRYEQTQAFRHDIKSHLSGLSGLLEHGETEKAKSYLGKLDTISEALSFPCKTGNTVVDTLLSGKLNVACQMGIQVECTVKIKPSCTVDDLDLCVLFSNAVDNAICACGKLKNEARYIHISGKEKGDFFVVEIENSCSQAESYKKGIGLSNIRAVAEKYHGAVTAEKKDGYFRLSVLLIISRHLDDISV